ncbi:hypothetical protein MTR67_019220 [Solanum verrucosum]|uniref:Uncharacterized protein n=1 Tax=Solanum verrucosum TaxID=315347 RepID=A0AAF0QNS9_SOLVR|nr:hypothetical protein MTR67_019220 [Solanum verrucosum]
MKGLSKAATSKRIDPFTFLYKTITISGRDATRGEQMLRALQGYSAKDSRTRAETEQWSQMQEMLQQVRGEKEELQASRDFWEKPALDFAREIQSLQSSLRIWFLVSNDTFDEISFDLKQFTILFLQKYLIYFSLDPRLFRKQSLYLHEVLVEEWKGKLQAFETKAKDMQCELTAAKDKLEKSRTEKSTAHDQREKLQKQRGVEVISTKDLPPVSLGKQLEGKVHVYALSEVKSRGQ